MKSRRKFIHKPLMTKVVIPIVILVLAITAAALSVDNWTYTTIRCAAWKYIGDLTGQTNFTHTNEIMKGTLQYYLFYTSRALGLVFISYALLLIIFGYYQNIFSVMRILRWRLKLWGLCKNKITLVCGLNKRAYPAIIDLLDEGRKVICITNSTESSLASDLRQRGVIIFDRDPTLPASLLHAKVKIVDEIFLHPDTEDISCRIALQLYNIFSNHTPSICTKFLEFVGLFKIPETQLFCYINTRKLSTRTFIEELSYSESAEYDNRPYRKLYFQCYNPDEMIVINMLKDYGIAPVLGYTPVKFNKNLLNRKTYNVHSVIFGSSSTGRTILEYSLCMLHLFKNQKRRITVICDNAAGFEKSFYSKYPFMTSPRSKEMEIIVNDIFSPETFELEFIELPKSIPAMLSDGFALYDNFNQKDNWRINVYFCLKNNVNNLTLAKYLQDRLKWLYLEKTGREYSVKDSYKSNEDLQLFYTCLFDYPDSIGENRLTGDIPVLSTYSKICSPDKIRYNIKKLKRNMAISVMLAYDDDQRKRINGLTSEERDLALERMWLSKSYWHRESNRQSALHIGIKFSLLGFTPDELNLALFENETSVTKDLKERIVKMLKNYKSEMSEIEHRRWCAERLFGGFIPLSDNDSTKRWFENNCKNDYYSVLKNKIYRHADLIPYDSLKKDEKQKDAEMINFMCTILGVEKTAKGEKIDSDITNIVNNNNVSDLPDDIIEQVAERVHARWYENRQNEGWVCGNERNDKLKQTPCLVAYNELPENEKEYDRETARETIAALLDLGYIITKNISQE